MICCILLSLTIVFILPQVLCHPSNAEYEFYLGEWSLNHITHWLVPPISIVPPLSKHIMQTGHYGKSNGLWLGWGVRVLPFAECRVFHVCKTQAHIDETPCRYPVDFSMFDEFYKYCLEELGLTDFGMQSIILASVEVVWMFPWDVFGKQLNLM